MEVDGGSELVDLASSPEPEHKAALVGALAALMEWRMRHSEHVLTHFNNRAEGSVQTQPTLHESAVAARL